MHIILPQYCSQLKAITALKLGAAVFLQPTAVWQRERWMPAVTTFPSALLITVTGAGLRLLPAAGGRTAEELQHLLSGLGCSTQEWLLIKWSRGGRLPTKDIKLWQSKWRKKFSFVLFYHGAFWFFYRWSEPGAVLPVDLNEICLKFAVGRIQSLNQTPSAKHKSLYLKAVDPPERSQT